jgi:hypothetical protein
MASPRWRSSIVTFDLAGRSLSEGFINLDAALMSPGNLSSALETNSSGY